MILELERWEKVAPIRRSGEEHIRPYNAPQGMAPGEMTHQYQDQARNMYGCVLCFCDATRAEEHWKRKSRIAFLSANVIILHCKGVMSIRRCITSHMVKWCLVLV